MRLLNFLMVLCLLVYSVTPQARPAIFSDWVNFYPESSSDDAGCQLCHDSAGGGQPWNAYGWEVRDAMDGGLSPSEAFAAVEFTNLYNDLTFPAPIDEIIRGYQPGWRVGNVNTLFTVEGEVEDETTGHPPPASIPANEIDFPTPEANPTGTTITAAAEALDLEEIASGFNAPVRAVRAPGIDGSLFVVEQKGKIFRVDLSTGNKTLFYDVATRSNLVDINLGYDERGLLGLAFHPNYQENGLFYTYQSEKVDPAQDGLVDFTVNSSLPMNHRSMVVEYKAYDSSCNSYIGKQQNLMIIDQPLSNHNGGDLVFDQNGLLYVALGDGGNKDDVGAGHGVLGNGRDKTTILGSILRIDPLGNNSANGKYGIPIDNPFTDVSDIGLDEIFAYGFRNPYRMSVDASNGLSLYTGDVGQEDIEEVNLVTMGKNYGWNWKEGEYFFYHHSNLPTSDTSYLSTVAPPDLPNDLEDPIGQYDQGDGISVIGGYVYRGSTLANTSGYYVFGEFSGPDFLTATGRLLRLDEDTGEIEEFPLMNAIQGYVNGFGQDADNELYVLINNTYNPGGVEGKLLKLVEAGDAVTFPSAEGESAMCPPGETLCIPIKTTNDKIATICL
jgi:glucose/arabinose dehydrogenase